MALVKISELPATSTVLDSQEIPTNNAGVNEKITVGQIRNGSTYSITTDYNMSLTDGYTRIYFNHSATTKKITVNLPSVASSIGREILFLNLAAGLSEINGNGANINFRGESITNIKLVSSNDLAILISDGTAWRIKKIYLSRRTGWIYRNDLATVHIGNGITYDTKSAGVDFTGQKLVESGGGNTNTYLCIYDSGGTGLSGVLYVVNVTGTGNGINNDTLTCGNGGYTCLVNEVSGSSQDKDYNFYHGFGLNMKWINRKWMYFSSDGTEANCIDCEHANGTVATVGFTWYQIDAAFFKSQVGSSGISYILDNGTGNSLTTATWCNQLAEIWI